MSIVFFSYSHEDENLRDQLEIHLSLLKRQGLIESWHDRRISPGTDFAGQISAALERAEIILLLISPHFIASDYCYDLEMRRAMERHASGEARVIPVILRPCDWKSAPFGAIQGLPRDAKPIVQWPNIDEAFLDVVTRIRELLQVELVSNNPDNSDAEATVVEVEAVPRSSNLRVRKTFTDVEIDKFLNEAFLYMARFFRSSLAELQSRHNHIDMSFKQIDTNRFTASIYENGAAVSRCRIAIGGHLGQGITYSMSDRDDDSSFNENLSIESDDFSLFLQPAGFASFGTDRKSRLTFEGAAEYYWSIFIKPVQGN